MCSCRYDLLDYTKNAFDRDFLEYNVNISELETAIQVVHAHTHMHL